MKGDNESSPQPFASWPKGAHRPHFAPFQRGQFPPFCDTTKGGTSLSFGPVIYRRLYSVLLCDTIKGGENAAVDPVG